MRPIVAARTKMNSNHNNEENANVLITENQINNNSIGDELKVQFRGNDLLNNCSSCDDDITKSQKKTKNMNSA
ncbi:unnamed protein product [Orchesella dallaii]|uniref:Uncharacterized protein n=1 Tax=Orchesella dallaii TaxID=48710 RepID=A0ABP1REM8_9HEXA